MPTGVNHTIHRERVTIDAAGLTLGRLATQIAILLRGKHKPTFTPHRDCGDFVHVVNAGRVRFTGAKLDAKMYHRHSGYPGGLRSITLRERWKKEPDAVIAAAVRGMLPATRLRNDMLKRLTVESFPDHI
jgi:large subunit ribosomal protein L13